MQDFGDFQCTKRGGFGWLEDDRIAASQRWRAFPAGDLRRVIPRTDAHTQAQRFAAGINPVFAQLNMLSGQGRGDPAEIFQRIGPAGRIRHRCFLIRFASVIGFQHRQIMIAFAHDIGGTAQDAAAFGTGHRGPSHLRRPCRGDGLFDDLGRGGMDFGDHRTSGGVNHLDRRACGVFDIGTVDEMAGGGLGLHISLSIRVGGPLGMENGLLSAGKALVFFQHVQIHVVAHVLL